MKHLRRSLILITFLFIVLSMGSLLAVSAQPEITSQVNPEQQPGTVTLDGILTVLHKDPAPGSNEPYIGLVLLQVSADETYVLDMPMGQVWDYIRQQVRVVGRRVSIPAAENFGYDTLINVDFILPIATPTDVFLDPSAGTYRFINVLCQFSDTGAAPREPSYFNTLFSTSFPGIGHHWGTVSGGKVSLAGTSTMTTWVRMGIPSGNYSNNSGINLITNACLNAANPLVDFSQYEGINFMFDFRYASFALGSPGQLLNNLDGQTRQWRMTWNPPFSWADQYFISHEIGHAINLPHSGGDPVNRRFVYDNLWDVMSGGGENYKLTDTTIGGIGPGTNAYYAYRLGWLEESEVQTVSTRGEVTITLERLLDPVSTNNKRLIIIPIEGSATDFYAVEAHFENSYDAAAPGTGVVIYRVILDRGEDGLARIVDPDANDDVNDAGATWTVGESFQENGVTLEVESQDTSSFTVVVNNASGGEPVNWIAPVGVTTTVYGNPTYEWEAVNGATSYLVYVAPKATPAAASFFGSVPASTYCTGGKCTVDLTDLQFTAWLANGAHQAYICPSVNNCNTLGGWTGLNPTIEFTVDATAPTAIPTSDFFSNDTGIGWNLTGAAANSTWYELYIAPTNNIGAFVYYNWQNREQLCGSWTSTTCTLPSTITNLFTAGTQYTIYFRSWGSGGFSTGGIVGWAGPFDFTP